MGADYLHQLSHLRTDASSARWPAALMHRAPHKPILLLAVLDHIAQHILKTNFIQLNADLIDIFDLYWDRVVGPEKNGNPVYPFFHLKTSGFWHLVPVPGQEKVLAELKQVSSIVQLQRVALGATLEDTLYQALQSAAERDEVRRVLIETYFAPELRPALVEVGHISAQSFQYSLELRHRVQDKFALREEAQLDERYETEARSVAFRRVVVDAYAHTCALCGIRIVTPEGRTAVAAAHIVPWSLSHNDDPRNGMALCGLHHWTFDQGMVGVNAAYCIEVSPLISQVERATQPLTELSGRELQRPGDKLLWPARQALEWHRKKVFRTEALRQLW